jgi:hypothetical protein
VWLKDEGERPLLRELLSLWTKAFEEGERGAFGGVSKSFGWVVVSMLVFAVSVLLWYITVLIMSSFSSLSPVDPRCLKISLVGA